MAVPYRDTSEGMILNVRAAPRSGKAGLDGLWGDDAVKVRVRSAPVDGKANKELLETVAAAFGLAKRDVTLVSGDTSKTKRVLLKGLHDVRQVLAGAGVSAVVALMLAFVCCCGMGCTHQKFVTDARHPEIAISEAGIVTFRGEKVDADELPEILRDAGYPASETINIAVPSDLKDYRMPYYVMGVLAQNGFRRPILVTERKSYSQAGRYVPPVRKKELGIRK